MKARTVGIAGTSFQLSFTLLLSNSGSCGSSDHSFLRVTPPFYIGTDSANPQNTNKMPMPGEHTKQSSAHQNAVPVIRLQSAAQSQCRPVVSTLIGAKDAFCIAPVSPASRPASSPHHRPVPSECSAGRPSLGQRPRRRFTWPTPPAALHLASAPDGAGGWSRQGNQYNRAPAGGSSTMARPCNSTEMFDRVRVRSKWSEGSNIRADRVL